MSYTTFISDIHLEENNVPKMHSFSAWLEQQSHHADAIYILGDLLDVWVGGNKQNQWLKPLQQALLACKQNQVPVYFMPGNRDFLINQEFCQQYHMQFIHDPTKINLYGKPTLLAHGDAYCSFDKYYTLYRKLIRANLTKKIFQLLGHQNRITIGEHLRNKSQKSNQKKPIYLMDVCPNAITTALHASNCDLIIHGHTHMPNIHRANHQAHRIVLGAWHQQGWALQYYPNHKTNLYKVVLADTPCTAKI